MLQRDSRRRLGGAACGLAAAIAVCLAAAPCQAGDAIEVVIDKAALVKLERPAAEIVVGNPSIADVSVQNSKLLVVTGKSYGRTNLIVLDAHGDRVLERDLSVLDPGEGMVTVHRGSDVANSVYCDPKCTTPLVIGDQQKYFDTTLRQITQKQGLAEGNAGGAMGQ